MSCSRLGVRYGGFGASSAVTACPPTLRYPRPVTRKARSAQRRRTIQRRGWLMADLAQPGRSPMPQSDMSGDEGMAQHLATLDDPSASHRALYHAIHELGHARCLSAQAAIERFLNHDDPNLRYVALEVLTTHFRATEHRQTAIDFLRHDPFVLNRIRGASGIMDLKLNTRAARVLRALARGVRDASEETGVRGASYAPMRGIIAYDPAEQSDLSGRDLDFETDIDWALVDSYATDARCSEEKG